MNLFFVCGAPKSGTTWVQRILDEHPQVACAGEGHFIQRFTIPAAKVVNEYNGQLALESERVYEGRPYYAPVDQAEFDEVARTFILGRLQSRKPGPEVRWRGDKTPGYTRHLPQLHRLFPQARIIHVLRDPRDVAVSRMGHHRRVGREDALTPGSEQHRLALQGAMRSWIEAVSRVDSFAAAHPDVVLELRYGNLHADPAAEITRLFSFLGADTDPALIARIAQATSFQAMSGRKPGEEDPEAFLRNGMPGDWKNRLDAETAALIMEACGELMRAKAMAD